MLTDRHSNRHTALQTYRLSDRQVLIQTGHRQTGHRQTGHRQTGKRQTGPQAGPHMHATYRKVYREAILQTERLKYRQANRQTDRQTNRWRQTDSTDRQAYR